MKDITLSREESRLFEEAVDAAARIYHDRAHDAAQGTAPAFGVDDQPAETPPVDTVSACALMVTMSALRETAQDLRKMRIGTDQRGPLALSWRWADEKDEGNMETVITIHRDSADTTGAMLLQAVFNANIRERAPSAQLTLLERLTQP